MKKINITTIGWGKGSYTMLSSIKWNQNYNISAIISTSDSWGSTWVLMKEFNTPPVWDLRRGIQALSSEHEIFKQLLNYRFPKESSVWGHNLWNLIMTAMTDLNQDFEKWIKQTAKLFKVKGKVIPVTLEKHNLCVTLENGQIICWEANIDEPKHNSELRIINTYLQPKVIANKKAIKAIEKADMIVLNFWDLYTSLLPNLLVNWVCQAIRKNRQAKVVYFCNLMTKWWETHDFEVLDFIDTVERYLWQDIIDYVVVNNWYVSEKLAEKYEQLEWKRQVKIRDNKCFKNKKFKIFERDLLHENDFVRHSFDKIAKVIEEIIEKEKL